MNRVEQSQTELKSDNFENVAYVCCDAGICIRGWGNVDHIATVDFDELTPEVAG